MVLPNRCHKTAQLSAQSHDFNTTGASSMKPSRKMPVAKAIVSRAGCRGFCSAALAEVVVQFE
jgi:hypothetical protein